MLIVHIGGGFGNQLFTYAFGYALAKRRGESLYIDTAIQDAEWFFRDPLILSMNIEYGKRISYKIGRSFLDRAILNRIRYRLSIGLFTKEIRENPEDKGRFHEEYLEVKDPRVYMRGDWQAETYFSNIREDLLRCFTFREALSVEANTLYEEINQNPNSVTIHLRRGDYVALGICPSEEYFIRAVKMLTDKLDHPVFYCFSEDIEWVKALLSPLKLDIRYPQYQTEKKDIEDFRLLGAGSHMILSNSSYSWWAAWLNSKKDKTVICPQMEKGDWNGDFWPAGWIQIQNQ